MSSFMFFFLLFIVTAGVLGKFLRLHVADNELPHISH
jgi:hypothetical protein